MAPKPRKSKQKAVRHSKRPNAKGVDCPECGKTLKTQGFLDRHLRQKHSFAQPAPVSAAESSSTD